MYDEESVLWFCQFFLHFRGIKWGLFKYDFLLVIFFLIDQFFLAIIFGLKILLPLIYDSFINCDGFQFCIFTFRLFGYLEIKRVISSCNAPLLHALWMGSISHSYSLIHTLSLCFLIRSFIMSLGEICWYIDNKLLVDQICPGPCHIQGRCKPKV